MLSCKSLGKFVSILKIVFHTFSRFDLLQVNSKFGLRFIFDFFYLTIFVLVSDETPHLLDFQLNMVSKWVDYTNKYGFGCVLSDGTHCTLFVDNSSVSRRQFSHHYD